ncbi:MULTISPECIES: hypothetical protein [unclassified Mesorhizobium]|uniref:hypothetical protein n=1 Tax=unclassified Mesorhizobium TaxID=325217 RepID=UPI001093C04B|nr:MULTISPECIES: hypothetical protein [unclassified Mesorhizobium]TGS45201.1 hypothetical protein EN825_15655 [Mesorhizobium sp. M8A.F.Ca.ET.182.01.1.1]TGS80901.1 hypothetical protein EN824_15890 [Mesorhizobium sp. M8A.F.Ca.ET.181.01.1.1]
MSDSTIVISEDSVRQECEQIMLAFKEWEARKLRFDKMVEFLRAAGKDSWVPASYAMQAETAETPGKYASLAARNGPTWAGEVLRTLASFPNGATSGELLEVIQKGPFGERATKNPPGIYNTATKLERTGEVKRHNGRLFLPANFDRFMERVRAGEVEDYKGSGAAAETIGDMLVKIIASSDGLEAGEIVKKMGEQDVLPASVYNNLSKIVQKGRVRREGKIYLPLKNEALPEQSESASQITGNEGESSLPNMGSGNS